ncbi:MAG: hypothetical protein QXW00_01880 [Candidatus Woesearchaeota archaeon]
MRNLPLRFSGIETLHILISTVGVGLAFSIAYQINILIALLTIGIGFVIHEIAHKIVAQHYGCFAEFRADFRMLILAVLLSLLGVVFAAPGAVIILNSRPMKKREIGSIASAGPLANIILALFFLVLLLSSTSLQVKAFASAALTVNAWLSLFNMLPFFNFDGRKVFYWSRTAFAVMLAASLILLIISEFFISVPTAI